MSDKVRNGRGVDDRDVVRRAAAGRRLGAEAGRAGAVGIDRVGRESQRRASAYGRARGRL